jgi:hypothetical protein
MAQLKALAEQRKYRKDMIKMFANHRATGKEYYESIFWASMLFNSGLAILPSKNQINNLGLMADSTHFTASAKTTPKRFLKIFTMKRYELEFPLKHPRYVIENVGYKDRLYKILAWRHPLTKISYSLEELWLNIRYGQFGNISKAFTRRIRKWLGTEKHA